MNQDLIFKLETYIAKLKLVQIVLDNTSMEKAKAIIKAVTDIDLDDLEKVI